MDNDFQKTVSEKLDQAVENGYDQTMNFPAEVAIDMVNHDSDIEHWVEEVFDGDLDLLIPYIEVWQKGRSN